MSLLTSDTETPGALRQRLEANMLAERASWETFLGNEGEKGSATLVGEPYIVACGDTLGMALLVEGSRVVPCRVKPGLPGVSHFTEPDAKRVAALRGDPYRPVHIRDVPHLRIREINAALDILAGLDTELAGGAS